MGDRRTTFVRRCRTALTPVGVGLLACGASLVPAAAHAGGTTPGPNFGGLSSSDGYTTTANLAPGSISHVWLIIPENKSYNSEFSGIHDAATCGRPPLRGCPAAELLRHRPHRHGQLRHAGVRSGPQNDVQSDCSNANTVFAGNTGITAGAADGIVDSGTGGTSVGGDNNWSYGQAVSKLGPNSPSGTTAASTNERTYTTDVVTLFDQFNLAGVTWKGYAQGLGGAQQIGSTSLVANSVPGRDSGACGAPGNPDGMAENPVSNPTYLSGAEGYPVASELVSSTASGGSTSTLLDVSQTWPANAYTNDEVMITGGTGAGEYGAIASNTSNTLTLSANFDAAPGTSVVAPDGTSTYIVGVADTSTYTAASLVAGNGTGPDGQAYSTNNPEYADQYVA